MYNAENTAGAIAKFYLAYHLHKIANKKKKDGKKEGIHFREYFVKNLFVNVAISVYWECELGSEHDQ